MFFVIIFIRLTIRNTKISNHNEQRIFLRYKITHTDPSQTTTSIPMGIKTKASENSSSHSIKIRCGKRAVEKVRLSIAHKSRRQTSRPVIQ